MSLRSELEKKIEKKQQEIAGYDRSRAEAESYLKALQDMLKMLPKEAVEVKAQVDKVKNLGNIENVLK